MRQQYVAGTMDQEFLEAQAAYDQALQNFNNAAPEFVDAAIFELNAASEKLQRTVKTPKWVGEGSIWWKSSSAVFERVADHTLGTTMYLPLNDEGMNEACGNSH